MTSIPYSQRLSDPVTAYAGQTDFEAGFPPPAKVEGAYVDIYIDRLRPPALFPDTLNVNVHFGLVNIQTNSFTARLVTPAQAGDVIRVYGRGKESRQSTYAPGKLDSAALELEFVRQSVRLQEHARDIQQAVRVQFGDRQIVQPRAAARAGKLAAYDANGDVDVSRDLVSFDADVASTAAHRAAADEAQAQAASSAADAHAALVASSELYQGISDKTLQSIGQIIDQYDTVVQNLSDQEAGSLSDISTAKTQATTAIAAAKADAQASIATDKQTAQNAANEALAVLEVITPLPDRVTALENPFTVALVPSISQSEIGTSVAVTLTATYNQALASAVIDQGVGAISTAAGAHAGIGTGANVSADKTWTLTGSNGYTSKTAAATIRFLNRMMWGSYATDDLATKTPVEIRAALVGTSALATDANRVFSVNAGDGDPRWVYFAVPATWSLSAFTAYGFDELSNLTVSTVNINDAAGNAVSCHLYRLPNALTGIVPMVTNA